MKAASEKAAAERAAAEKAMAQKAAVEKAAAASRTAEKTAAGQLRREAAEKLWRGVPTRTKLLDVSTHQQQGNR